MRGKDAEPVLRIVASIAAVTAAGAVVWAILGFARVGFAEAEPATSSRTAQPATDGANGNATSTNTRSGTLARRECLVYITDGDATHYHSSVHTAAEAARKAVSIDLARSKGLEPCATCFRGKSDGTRAVVSTGTARTNR